MANKPWAKTLLKVKLDFAKNWKNEITNENLNQ